MKREILLWNNTKVCVKNYIVFLIFLFLFLGNITIIKAEITLPRLISDGMVLQRDMPLKIWGWADANEKVLITFKKEIYKTKADKQGNWVIELPASEAGGPFNMQINEVKINDILIGDVWLCSGQSNMELPISRVLDLYEEEIKKVNNTNIRQFKVLRNYSFTSPETNHKSGKWVTATQENIMDFYAVSYFFADKLYEKYNIPIGLINSAVGGSPAEAWLSADALKKYPTFLKEKEKCSNQAYIDSVQKTERKNQKAWFEELNQKDPGVNKWLKTGIDVSDWKHISIPGYWIEKGETQKNGSFWFHRKFNVIESLHGKEATLRLGRIIDSDSVFINGIFVGTTSYQYPPRIYKIPKGVLKRGENEITVRVISERGRGGFMEEKPYKMVFDSYSIDLTGDWLYKPGADMKPTGNSTFFHNKPGGLFNGMIGPTLNYGKKGVIWFQGESNVSRSDEYYQLFTDLIMDWRISHNNLEMPFIYAQLSRLGIPNKQITESNWAELRDAQRRTLKLPNTGMAVTFDIGEWNDIHPLNKKDVGSRLALEAQRVAYNDSTIVSSGPLYKKMEVKENNIEITFSSVGSGLFTNNLLKGFTIAGEDGEFAWAKAVVISKNKVKVWSNEVSNPTAVRYAWEDNPIHSNLKNKEGLPASPFTTITR